jgi:hypothetical protein
MRSHLITAALAAICFTLPATAQKVRVFGGIGQRASTSVLFFGENVMGAVTIVHGEPQWQPSYDGRIDEVKGKLLRLGKDLWTTYMSSVDVEIGGVNVPAGSYVVGLQCDEDGNFGLAFLDATKALKNGTMPFGAQTWTPDVVAPLALKRNASEEVVSKLKMELTADEEDPPSGNVTLSWGKHQLHAALKIHIAEK